MGSKTRKTAQQAEATVQKAAQRKAKAEGLRRTPHHSARGVADHFVAELRRLHPSKEVRAMMKDAPAIGASSLQAVHAQAIMTMANQSMVYRAFCTAMRDCNPEEDGLTPFAMAELALKAANDHATAMKRTMDAVISVNRLYLDRDLDRASGDIQVGVDEWNEDILEALSHRREEADSVH